MKNVVLRISFLVAVMFAVVGAHAKSYYEINIFMEIGATSWMYLKGGLKAADEKMVDGVFIHLNTYGGLVEYADSMRTAILNYAKPVYVFIDNNAASAGALISIACDSIYMRDGASIGAATVVNEDGEKMPDKYQSYMRSIIRSTAESHGKYAVSENGDTLQRWRRDPKIEEAMVDESVVVPQLVDSTKILTFTVQEARLHGYCEGVYRNIDEIITVAFKENDYELTSYNPTAMDNLKGWLMNPVLQGILIMLIIGGIYFEMQTPGIGFPLAVSVVAAVFYFAPLYVDGLAEAWEGVLIVVGLFLIVVEVFFIPGFGVAGIIGIVLLISGFLLSMIPNDFFSFNAVSNQQVYTALTTVLCSIIGSTALVVYLTNKIGADGVFKNLALQKSLDDEYVGYSQKEVALIGKTGVAETNLMPSGKVNIDGEMYPAISMSGYIDEGSEVVVKKYSTGQLYVKSKK